MLTRTTASVFVLLFLAVSAPAAQRPAGADRDAPGQDRPHKWWSDVQTRNELGLSDEQAGKAEAIFQASVPQLQGLWKSLDQGENELSTLIRESKADESVIAAKVDEVERVRAELNKTRTLMLYRIHRLLTPDQQEKLNAIHDQERQRRRLPNERIR